MYAPECKALIKKIPKAELHVHIEGTLEPQMLVEIARRNRVPVPVDVFHTTKEEYRFHNLESFVQVYAAATSVLQVEQDFYDLTYAYLRRSASEGAVHVEFFFDIQTYLPRGIMPEVIINGMSSALRDAQNDFGITAYIIMCFIRHLSEKSALHALELIKPFGDKVIGVGLAAIEDGNPPSKFKTVFEQAAEYGYRRVAHVAESKNGAELVRQALEILDIERIDHGVGSIEDDHLVSQLVRTKVPLTLCPQSNLSLGIFDNHYEFPLKKMFDTGLFITLNSDDPAFFNASLLDNYYLAGAMGMKCYDLVVCARNSLQASFLPEHDKALLIKQLTQLLDDHECS